MTSGDAPGSGPAEGARLPRLSLAVAQAELRLRQAVTLPLLRDSLREMDLRDALQRIEHRRRQAGLAPEAIPASAVSGAPGDPDLPLRPTGKRKSLSPAQATLLRARWWLRLRPLARRPERGEWIAARLAEAATELAASSAESAVSLDRVRARVEAALDEARRARETARPEEILERLRAVVKREAAGETAASAAAGRSPLARTLQVLGDVDADLYRLGAAWRTPEIRRLRVRTLVALRDALRSAMSSGVSGAERTP